LQKLRMTTIRSIRSPEIEIAHRLHNRFTDQDTSLATIKSWYEQVPELFIGVYDNNTPIGICIGRKRDSAHAELAGLGVIPEYRQQGIGTRLLERFEHNAKNIGIERITLGSAGGYVDQFYVDNGYTPEKILVRVSTEQLPNDDNDVEYEIIEEKEENGTRKIYINATEVDQSYLNDIRTTFGDDEAIYIMAKHL
ncbi:MAG: GNAT family N-acetyltransferase, partial [Halobacteriaceae archaeon]